jgi:hypothetical protein
VLTGIASSSSARHLASLHLHGTPSHFQVAQATVHGFHNGYLIGSTFGIIASLVATFVIKEQRAKADPSHGEAAIPV